MSTTIEWTDETWNPVTGCTRVSPGCDHCYMFALYPRLTAMGVPGYEGDPRHVKLLPDRLTAPLRWARPRRVFVNSMSDVFHPRVPYEFINRIFDVMRDATEEGGHVFQVLTKRPGRAVGWWERHQSRYKGEWPDGVWIGTSVESQKYAPRIAVLARLPAAVRFVSAEPLLGAVDLSHWLEAGHVQWVIAGGESGPAARPMELDWARDLRGPIGHSRSSVLSQAAWRKAWQAVRGRGNPGRTPLARIPGASTGMSGCLLELQRGPLSRTLAASIWCLSTTWGLGCP